MLLAQTEVVAGTSSLASVAAILTATWLIVALLKAFLPGITGRGTLGVALAIAVGLTVLAIYGTQTLEADVIDALLAVITGVAGASGIQASGKTIAKTQTKTGHRTP